MTQVILTTYNQMHFWTKNIRSDSDLSTDLQRWFEKGDNDLWPGDEYRVECDKCWVSVCTEPAIPRSTGALDGERDARRDWRCARLALGPVPVPVSLERRNGKTDRGLHTRLGNHRMPASSRPPHGALPRLPSRASRFALPLHTIIVLPCCAPHSPRCDREGANCLPLRQGYHWNFSGENFVSDLYCCKIRRAHVFFFLILRTHLKMALI